MRHITRQFFEDSSIDRNADTIAVMDFLASPQSVNKMIIATEKRSPALAGVVEELENRFADCEKFPLNHEGEGKNAKNRRNVGWMVRYIMREYGYTPLADSERTRIGSNSGSRFFGNAAVYEKTEDNPNYHLISHTMVTSKSWTAKDMMIKKDDPTYSDVKDRMKEASRKLKEMKMSSDFFVSYLLRTGFDYCISLFDIMMIFHGFKVPCVELAEAIEAAISLFYTFYIERTCGFKTREKELNEKNVEESSFSGPVIFNTLYSEEACMGEILRGLFDQNAAGLNWKSKSSEFLPLVEFARWQQQLIKEKTIVDSDLAYFTGLFKSLVERINTMAASCIEPEERIVYESECEKAKCQLEILEHNPKALDLNEYYDLIVNNWEGLSDWTITYRFLAQLVKLEKNWKENETSMYELRKIATEVTATW